MLQKGGTMKGKIFTDTPIVAIDIGTTKICVFIAQAVSHNDLEIIGVGKAPSHGLKKGVVIDINQTVYSIKQAIQEAELMGGCKVESACIGISGSHIRSLTSHGMVPIKRSEVTRQDIANVISSAKAVPVAEGQQILHVLPQYFVVDSSDRIHDPIGMHGVRLEGQVHIITGSISHVQNLVKCCQMAGISITDIILEQLASALAVLSPDERQLGVGILDIGGGTSDFALYYNKSIFYTKVIPVAGNHFTNDLALGLRTTIADAERIKKEHGFVYKQAVETDGFTEVESVGGGMKQHVIYSELSAILQPRTEELLWLVQQALDKNNLNVFMPAGMVLTGGGSLLRGIQELATEIFSVPVRIGTPQVQHTLLHALDNPMYATGYGLLLHALQQKDAVAIDKLSGPLVLRIASRMKSWVSDFF
jgi:cell division protein FtsA